jgi:putative ABC transport system permease protein
MTIMGSTPHRADRPAGIAVGWLDGFGMDLRYGLRALKQSPGFAAFVILTIAFGIASSVTVYALIREVLMESLPFADAGRLYVIAGASSVPAYERCAATNQLFSNVAAWVNENMTVAGPENADRIYGARVTASFFPALGVRPLLGRSFAPEQDRPGGALVAVISYGAWQRRFGRDPAILGKTIRVNAEDLTVIGVLPPTFWFPGEPVEVWVPRVFDNSFVSQQMVRAGAGILSGVFARLRPEVTPEGANAALRAVAPEGLPREAHLEPMQQNTTAEIRPSLLLLWGAAGCILLVTCANVASLLLARATARRKEIAMRVALGVGRFRLVRQLLTESLVFAVIGGLLGVALSRVGLAAILLITGDLLTGGRTIRMGTPALVFGMGAAMVSALLFGFAPAVQALRSSPLDGIRDRGPGGASLGQPRLRSILVMAQTAAAVALAISAGLLLQSYERMRTLRTGIQTGGLITASVHLSDARYHAGSDRVRFYHDLLRRVRNIPGVSMAGATSALQLQSKGEGSMTWPEGATVERGQPPVVKNRNVSPDYFRALGIPVIAGRGFTEADHARSQNVMLVNESFARLYFPDGRAIGRWVTYTSEHVTSQIVGIVADVRPRMIDAVAQPEMYFPYMQRSRNEMTLVVRSSLSLAALGRAMQSELRSIDPEQAL